jgi:hypothetical protein
MPRASSSRRRPSSLALRAGSVAGCAALVAAAVCWPQSERPGSQAGHHAYAVTHTELSASSARRLATAAWSGRMYTTTGGETVSVFVAEGYLDGDAAGRRWAEFFGSLVHGSELGLFTAYVTTPTSVTEMCQNERALGCYGSSTLVIPGEPVAGVSPEEIARHEYGHHVAANRQNPPWRAIDWGTKRWASAAKVCARVGAGTAFPGDEDAHYEQNPGEGFAEAYRVLNEFKAGISSSAWSIVDPTYYPDRAALEALERDVLEPWTSGVTSRQRYRFAPGAKRVRTMPLATALDGDLAIVASFERGWLFDVDLLGPDGKRVLARALWSGASLKRLTYTICGERPLFLRIVRRGAPGRVVVTTTTP